jgi:hypothetical protein
MIKLSIAEKKTYFKNLAPSKIKVASKEGYLVKDYYNELLLFSWQLSLSLSSIVSESSNNYSHLF